MTDEDVVLDAGGLSARDLADLEEDMRQERVAEYAGPLRSRTSPRPRRRPVLIDGGGRRVSQPPAQSLTWASPVRQRTQDPVHARLFGSPQQASTSLPSASDAEELQGRIQAKLPFTVESSVTDADLYEALFGTDSPNRRANRLATESLGPHFDHYLTLFNGWSVWVPTVTEVSVDLWHLPKEVWEVYLKLTAALPKGSYEVLRDHRHAVSKLVATSAPAFSLKASPGTRLALWHGDATTPPMVHSMSRFITGEYTIIAHQVDDLRMVPAGFIAA